MIILFFDWKKNKSSHGFFNTIKTPKYMHIHINLDIDNYLQMTIHEETLLGLKKTIDFPIHLSYKTGH